MPTSYKRLLDLPGLLEKKSFFLLGPRATGKSHLIRTQLQERAQIIDLLEAETAMRMQASPGELEKLIQPASKWVVIDEIQKVPALLDEVHRLIEKEGLRFLLTGSSARRLKQGHANLLGGRARLAHMFPLTFAELPKFDLDRYLRFGGLPGIQASDAPEEDLQAYALLYLREEIQSEGLVRNLPRFSRFLQTAALANGQMINFAQVASDSGVAASTVKEHFQILQDTFIGFALEPWTRSRKRKAIATAKFYFFDTGVAHTLAGTRTLERNSDLYGRAFEQWVGMELRAYLGYRRSLDPLSYWRSSHDHEVDYLVGDHTAIEVKATKRVSDRDLKGLLALRDEGVFKRMYLVSQDPAPSIRNGVQCVPWRTFAQRLWDDDLITVK